MNSKGENVKSLIAWEIEGLILNFEKKPYIMWYNYLFFDI